MNQFFFKSGEEYTLADFFSGNNKIIIPDLQRDYCWGNTQGNKDMLVSEFMTSLIELYLENPDQEFTLGLIYGYELKNNGLKGHTHLCDGQQRITTLFLLLGILNRKTKGAFSKYLISDFELNQDGQEPYLQYAIRESTLYFLSDLVCEFFLHTDTSKGDYISSVDDIKGQDWYFDDYSNDYSIISILKALKLIEDKLEGLDDLISFGDFLCNKIQMLYYDMGTRAQGEETFVIINKSGEPLTPSENLKPKYISQLESDQDRASKLWEEWENFFWLNRTGNGKKTNDTADHGLLEFLRWVVLLSSDKDVFVDVQKGEKFGINHLEVDEIQKYFEIVKFVFDDSGILPNNKDWLAPSESNDQIDLFRILPIIEYIKLFGKENTRNIVRVKQFFKNRSIDNNLNINNALYQSIILIRELPSDDIADVILEEDTYGSLVNKEERFKFDIYKKLPNREHIENSFWAQESHKIWDGKIMPILNWSVDDSDNFDINLFESYSKVFNTLFYDSLKYNSSDSESLDKVRRALLTRDLLEYPKQFKGKTNYSFCLESSDWRSLIKENEDKFDLFLSELLDKNEEEIYKSLDTMIDENPKEKDYDEFVKIPELLNYCTEKNIQWLDSEGWVLIKVKQRNGAHINIKTYRLYLEFKKDYLEKDWPMRTYEYEGGCIVFENTNVDIAIDVYFKKNNGNQDLFELQVFRRIERDNTFEKLSHIAEKNNLVFSDNNKYNSTALSKDDIKLLLQNIIYTI